MEKIDEDKNSNFICQNITNEINDKNHKIKSNNETYENKLIKEESKDSENKRNMKEKESNINSDEGFKPNSLLLDKIVSNVSNNAIELNSNIKSDTKENQFLN